MRMIPIILLLFTFILATAKEPKVNYPIGSSFIIDNDTAIVWQRKKDVIFYVVDKRMYITNECNLEQKLNK